MHEKAVHVWVSVGVGGESCRGGLSVCAMAVHGWVSVGVGGESC